MKTGTAILIGLAGLAAWEFMQLGVAGATYQIVFSGVQFKSLTNWVITLTVQNVSNANVQLNSLAGTITVNGSLIANISDFTPETVPANSQKDINVNVSPWLLNLPATIIDFVNNPTAPLSFNVNGNANIDNLVIPFDLDKQVTAAA